MPLNSSRFYEPESGLVTRVFDWPLTAATEFYPANPDDNWRWLPFCQVQFTLDPAGAAGTCQLGVVREGFTPVVNFWARHMLAGTDTTTPANLQSVEWMSDPNNYFVAPAGISANGILIPPRSRIRASRAGMSLIVQGIIHETEHIAALRGLT